MINIILNETMIIALMLLFWITVQWNGSWTQFQIKTVINFNFKNLKFLNSLKLKNYSQCKYSLKKYAIHLVLKIANFGRYKLISWILRNICKNIEIIDIIICSYGSNWKANK